MPRKRKPLLYLDTSAAGRLLDDYVRHEPGSERQQRGGRAAHAAQGLVGLVESGAVRAVASSRTFAELGRARGGKALVKRLRKKVRRAKVLKRDRRRAVDLAARNLSAPDAVHQAVAERVGATVILTTDAGFVTGSRLCGKVKAVDLTRWVHRAAPQTVKRTKAARKARKRVRKRL